MPKYALEPTPEARSAFFERRRLRRIRMIVELTHNLISTDRTVSHREARCLVHCARKAILDLFPAFEERYDRIVRPHFERVLHSRWPDEVTLEESGPCETIN
jgi:hypothetical protein